MKFSFDPEKHIYTLQDGTVLPGVTDVLDPLVDYSMVPPAVLKAAGDRGSDVHSMCAMDLNGILDEGSLCPEYLNYLGQFKLWRANEGSAFPADVVERGMVHPRQKYAGTADIISNGLAIIDIKTRDPQPPDAIQCCAYEKLWVANGGDPGPGPYQWFGLYLKQDSYKFKPLKDKQAWNKFRYMLKHYRANQEFERKVAIWKKS
jgi:hypothetical protein